MHLSLNRACCHWIVLEQCQSKDEEAKVEQFERGLRGSTSAEGSEKSKVRHLPQAQLRLVSFCCKDDIRTTI